MTSAHGPDGNRRVIHASCSCTGVARDFTNLVVHKLDADDRARPARHLAVRGWCRAHVALFSSCVGTGERSS